MKTMWSKFTSAFVALSLVTAFIPGAAVAYALDGPGDGADADSALTLEADSAQDTVVSVRLLDKFYDKFGQQPYVEVSLAAADGSPIDTGSAYTHADFKYYIDGKSSSGQVLSGDVSVEKYLGKLSAGEHTLYAEYAGKTYSKSGKSYRPSTSATVVFTTAVQDAPDATVVDATPSGGDGAIHALGAGPFQYSTTRPTSANTPTWEDFSGNTASGLDAGTYYIRRAPHIEGDTLYYSSLFDGSAFSADGFTVVEVGSRPRQTFTASFIDDEHATWVGSNRTYHFTEGVLEQPVVLKVGAEAGYIVTGAIAEPSGSARVEFDAQTGTATVADVVADARIVPVVVSRDDEDASQAGLPYSIWLSDSEHAAWSGYGATKSILVPRGAQAARTFLVSPDEGDRYYVAGVDVQPAGAATVDFDAATGNVTVTDVSSDVTLVPVVRAIGVPASIEVVERNVHSIEDDYPTEVGVTGLAVRVDYTVRVLDASGDPVPAVNVRFESKGRNQNEGQLVDWDNRAVVRTTSSEESTLGEATFTESYFAGFYESSFTVVSDDALEVISPLTVLNQPRFATDPSNVIDATGPNQHDGGYRDSRQHLEWFTYPLSDGTFFISDRGSSDMGGHWEPVSAGKIDGLAPGTYAVRTEQWVDEDTDVVYLYSYYTTFEVQVGRNIVTIANAGDSSSSNVTYTDAAELSQGVAQNGSAHFHVRIPEGYEILEEDIVVEGGAQSNPGYTSAGFVADADDSRSGYIVIEGVTRSLQVSATARQKARELSFGEVFHSLSSSDDGQSVTEDSAAALLSAFERRQVGTSGLQDASALVAAVTAVGGQAAQPESLGASAESAADPIPEKLSSRENERGASSARDNVSGVIASASKDTGSDGQDALPGVLQLLGVFTALVASVGLVAGLSTYARRRIL